ncbi:MAG TPA: hypothetical protein VGC56_14425 [Allosphingosinicella sp.]|jgi:hypothetical protein
MIAEADAVDLVQRLNRSAARSRPIVAVGLLFIIGGFIVLAVYLDSERRAALHFAQEQVQRAHDLDQTLDAAALIVAEPHGGAGQPSQWQRLSKLLNVAESQVNGLDATARAETPSVTPGRTVAPSGDTHAAADPTPAADTAPPKVIRLYFHVTDPAQKPAAAAVAASLSGQTLGASTIVVPGIELVPGAAGVDTVRCTKAAACAYLPKVTQWLNQRLASPKLRPLDLSARYGNSQGIKPGTYEVWFGTGPIAVAAGQ